ncbi:MAG TPA: CoA ester lyase, partial [Patescibacteria group bacterium]|nr:CoA ester lyase [Patescibacteria group bacterium]
EKEVAWSRKIIAAHAEATAEGKGVVVVDGRLVENLHVENARRIVALAEQIEG